MTTLVQNDEGYGDRNDGVNDDVGTSEGHAFSRAKKQPRRKGTASAVPENSRAEGASALPKAGVEAQPKRPVSATGIREHRHRTSKKQPRRKGTASAVPKSSHIGRARLQPCQKAATSEGHGFSRAKKQPHRKGTPSAMPKSSRAGRARLQPCQKTAAPKALPLCRRPEWRRSRNDPFLSSSAGAVT